MNKKIYCILLLFLICIVPSFVNAEEYGFINGDYVSMRSSAGSSSILDKVIYGTPVTIIGTSNNYYNVIYDGVNTAWVSKDYVLRLSDITANDDNYCNTLKEAGFPESYCPYLTYLHQKHPSWTFTASLTGLDFYTAVDQESDVNEIQITASSTDQLNKYVSAYAKSNYIVEGGSWYIPNQKVVAYFMDPRNFLHEKTIFMFQTLSFNEATDNATTLKGIFGNTYLSDDTYVNWFLDAGRTYNVSSLSLASRTIQEIGTSDSSINVNGQAGSYTAKNGTTYDINGLYNYYNIGAYSSEPNPTKAGLVYAGGFNGRYTSYLRPWTSRELAIKGGAAFLANDYISKGQDTLFYQKFNVGPNSTTSKYTHQYMGNILAPYDEGMTIKKSLVNNGLFDQPYNFTIPVYNNMPANTVQATLLNTNNYLSSIQINGTALSGFDEDILEYTYYILSTNNEINISATPAYNTSSVSGTGKISLTEDNTEVNLIVTSEGGTTRTYKIKIVKVVDTKKPEEVVGGINVKVNNTNIYDLSVGTLGSTLVSAGNGVSPYSVITVIDGNGATVDNNSTIKTGYKLIIKTPSQGEGVYTLSVHGDVNSDGGVTIQDLLRIQKHLLGSIQLSGAEYYAADSTGDGNVNIQDLLRVQKYLLGSSSL